MVEMRDAIEPSLAGGRAGVNAVGVVSAIARMPAVAKVWLPAGAVSGRQGRAGAGAVHGMDAVAGVSVAGTQRPAPRFS